MRRLLIATLTLLPTLVLTSPPADAILILDSTSFGTAVHFNTIPATCCAGLPSVAIIQDGIRISSDIQVGLDGSAQGQAIVAGVALPTLPPTVGIRIETNARRSVGAIGATGAIVTGLPGGSSDSLIPGSIIIDGTFVGTLHLVQLFVTDYLGHFLGAGQVEQGRLVPGGPLTETFNWDFCANPLAPNPSNLFCPQSFENIFGGWGGSATLPFNFPALPKNGVIVELHGDLFPFGPQERVDFLTSADLSFSPPPGVTVTLASGQTFGAPPPAGVPVPSTLLLFGTGLAGLVACRRRWQK